MSQRFEIRVIGDADCTILGDTVGHADDLKAARTLAADLAADLSGDHAWGVAIVDAQADTCDWGACHVTPVPGVEED